MGKRIKKLKKIRIHREGTDTLVFSAVAIVAIALLLWYAVPTKVPFWGFVAVFAIIYGVVLNFYRCPKRFINLEDTDKIVVAPADGKVVVIEEVEETEYFHDKRLMISIFMSLFNVHANWFPVAGKVIHVSHQQGRFMAAYLPKSSTDNERSTVVIKAENGEEILVRQIAGAVARRIVTYAEVGDTCDIDEHMGFIKFGSRVDLYLPLDCDIKVALHDKTIGDLTEIARLK